MKSTKIALLGMLMGISSLAFSQQIDNIKLDPEKVKIFTPVMEWKHGGKEKFEQWKNVNKLQYAKEMWYYTESYYIKRNQFNEGYEMNPQGLDISRFEGSRKKDEEAIVVVPGYKDVLVLLPESKLIYKLN
jgi:hypothetical protein